MSKLQQSNKELQKKPILTPKEKKAAKHVKKQTHDLLRMLPRSTNVAKKKAVIF